MFKTQAANCSVGIEALCTTNSLVIHRELNVSAAKPMQGEMGPFTARAFIYRRWKKLYF